MSLLRKFLALDRFKSLGDALQIQLATTAVPATGFIAVAAALLLALAPVGFTFLDARSSGPATVVPTLAFGVCAVLALMLRKRLKLVFAQFCPLWEPLSKTHTAVALGCIPAVLLLLFDPQLLAERHDVITEAIQPSEQQPTAQYSLAFAIFQFVVMAAWVAITEEIIFRGLLVSVIRRWTIMPRQWQRDILAALISCLLFGVAHYATWGLVASLALVGLGLGFTAAYLATGEKLLPVVLYHFVFDLLSILLCVFL